MTRVFAFTDDKNQPQVGVEWRGAKYNFTLAWELYKKLKLNKAAPSFQFIEMIIEMDLFHSETFDELFATLQEYRSIKDLRLRGHWKRNAPIQRPPKIIGIGRNYAKHAKELDNEIPEAPVFFAKAPSSIIASGDRIRIPPGIDRVDYEGELAVVIGKPAKEISSRDAFDYVAGYTNLNDVTARDIQQQDKEKKLPWFRAKSYDTFCPLGPDLIPKEEIADPQTLNIQVRINDEVRQSDNTKNMLFPIPKLIEFLSYHMTLQSGDIIATGTPHGVGALHKQAIVEVEIHGFDVLRNTVI